MRRRYPDVKYISTKKLEEILNSAPYYVTDIGTDYFDRKEEIQNVLWNRQQRETEREMRQIENEHIERLKIEARELNLKWCPKCDQALAQSNFSNRSDRPHLKRSHCKMCNNKHAKNNKVPF